MQLQNGAKVHTWNEECMCGATRGTTGKPGEYTYTFSTGESSKKAGYCTMREHIETTIAAVSRLPLATSQRLMDAIRAQVEELTNAGHMKDESK